VNVVLTYHAAKVQKTSKILIQRAINFLNDSLLTDLVLRSPSRELAALAVFVSYNVLDLDAKSDGRQLWRIWGIDENRINRESWNYSAH